jgi:hypothetical protein
MRWISTWACHSVYAEQINARTEKLLLLSHSGGDVPLLGP